MSVCPVAIYTLTPDAIGIITGVPESARQLPPSASQDPPRHRSASVLPPRTRSQSSQGRQNWLTEPRRQSAPAQSRSVPARASAAASQRADLNESRLLGQLPIHWLPVPASPRPDAAF